MKTILVTGADGMLGTDLTRYLRKCGHKVFASTIRSMDITKPEQVRRTLVKINPDLVIHTAAYTAVDKAESERELCMAVNADGARNVAMLCGEIGAEMIYISTDYVFDGKKKTPYIETDKPRPIGVYGESKWRGEEAVRSLVERHKICRTSWLIGAHGIAGTNFIEKIFRAADEKKHLRVVNDQTGRPTFTFDLAILLEKLAGVSEWGVFHTTNSGQCTWYELAKTALEMSGRGGIPIEPVSSSEYPTPAKRPANSLLDAPRLCRICVPLLRNWREALQEYLARRNRRKK